jgi:transposase-like protein
MSGKRKKYTPEFREQAARLVIETGRRAAQVADEIGVGEQVLGGWVRPAREAAAAATYTIKRMCALHGLIGDRRVGRDRHPCPRRKNYDPIREVRREAGWRCS